MGIPPGQSATGQLTNRRHKSGTIGYAPVCKTPTYAEEVHDADFTICVPSDEDAERMTHKPSVRKFMWSQFPADAVQWIGTFFLGIASGGLFLNFDSSPQHSIKIVLTLLIGIVCHVISFRMKR